MSFMLPDFRNCEPPPIKVSVDEAIPRIIFVVFQKERLSDGGVESAWQIVKSLKRYSPIVVTQVENIRTEKWKEAGISVAAYPLNVDLNVSLWRHSLSNLGKGIVSLIIFNYQIFKLVRAKRTSVVYVNDIHALFFAALGARLAGASIVWAIRDTQPIGKAFGLKWKIGSRLCKRILVLSNEMQKVIVSHGVCGAEKCRVLYSATAQTVAPLPIKRTRVVLGFIGAICPKKGQLEFLEKCSRKILVNIPEAELWFAGEPLRLGIEYVNSCNEFVRRENLSTRVKFCGFVSDISDFYKNCSLVVSASTHEGLPRAMIEALSFGVPVVSFGTCSAFEILEKNDCGVVVSENDYLGLADEIIALCKNPEARKRLAHNALKTSARLFSPHQVSEKFESMIDELEAR